VTVDYKQYQDPGVNVQEIPFPVVATAVLSPTVIGLLGDSLRGRQYTEIVTLTATTPVSLSKLGIDKSTIQVRGRFNGTLYTASTPIDNPAPSTLADYRILQAAGADGVKGGTGWLDDTTTIQRETAGTIVSGDLVTVTYRYSDVDYYNIYRFTDYDAVRDLYGSPFTSAGVLQSPLSLAAGLAFANGATEVLAAAVRPSGGYVSSITTTDWSTTLAKFENEPTVNVIVPVTGDTTVMAQVKAHLQKMEVLGGLRRAFVGLDGTLTSPNTDMLSNSVSQAASLDYTRMTIVAPGAFDYDNGFTLTPSRIGAQYAAAGAAGAHASRAPSVPLTNKRVVGFLDIPFQPSLTSSIDAQSKGVLVLSMNRDGLIRVKHGVTTKQNPSVYDREISVVASKDRLRDLIFDTLQASDLIGGVNDDDTPDNVVATVSNALEVGVAKGLIRDYQSVKFAIDDMTPTLITIRFQYQPLLPLNYILVQFALDTSSGAISDTTDTVDTVAGLTG
jgi:hypothetical protein